MVKNPPVMWEAWVQSLGGKIPWRRERLPTLVFLPGESSWTEKSGRLQSMGSQRVRHNWMIFTSPDVLRWALDWAKVLQVWGRPGKFKAPVGHCPYPQSLKRNLCRKEPWHQQRESGPSYVFQVTEAGGGRVWK